VSAETRSESEKTPIQMLHDRVLFDPEDKAEVEVSGELYIVVRERDIHAVSAERVGASQTGLYL
jgi:chaperonin GroES